jgi:hypothetical protein
MRTLSICNRREVQVGRALARSGADARTRVSDVVFRDLDEQSARGTHRRTVFDIVTIAYPAPIPMSVLKVITRVVAEGSPRSNTWSDEMTERAVDFFADVGLIERNGDVVRQHCVVQTRS